MLKSPKRITKRYEIGILDDLYFWVCHVELKKLLRQLKVNISCLFQICDNIGFRGFVKFIFKNSTQNHLAFNNRNYSELNPILLIWVQIIGFEDIRIRPISPCFIVRWRGDSYRKEDDRMKMLWWKYIRI